MQNVGANCVRPPIYPIEKVIYLWYNNYYYRYNYSQMLTSLNTKSQNLVYYEYDERDIAPSTLYHTSTTPHTATPLSYHSHKTTTTTQLPPLSRQLLPSCRRKRRNINQKQEELKTWRRKNDPEYKSSKVL